jgi:pentatricopeptide repeat protein
MSDAPIRLTLSRVEIGSLAYMSPEQLGGSTNEIDRRSDVYSLGVTLYELLALRLPFAEHDPLETRRAILEGAARPLRAFNRAVPRDLELVCAKAMERDLARRYSDAAAFARDLRNVLENRPIEARAPGKLRQWSRAIRRHPVAATILAASIVLPSALLWQAAAHASELGLALEAAKRERSKAQLEARDASEVNKFLVVLFSSVSPFLARGRTVTARDLLDEGDRRLETELAEQPLLRARLLNTLGESYAGLGEWERAENLIQRALELNQRHADAESMSMVESMNALSGLESSLGRPLALEHARRAAELHRKLAHEPTSDLALTLLNYGMALADDRQSAAAEAVFRESLAVLAALAGDQRSARATVLNSLANLYDDDGRFEEALAVAREALTLQRATGKAPHPTNSSTMNAMAVALTELGRFDEARDVYDELIDEERRLTGESSIDYARCLVSKANLEHRTGRLAETIALLERAAKTFEREAPPTFPAALICRARLADSYVQAARWVDAQSLSLELAPTLEAEFTPAGRQVLMNRLRSSRCHEALGEWEALEQELNSALESARGAAENSDPDAECEAGAHLARALARRGELDGAKACMARVIELGGIAAALDSRPGAWSHLAAGVVAQCSGDAQRALQELEPLAGLDRGPAFAEAAPSIARAHLAAVLAGSDVQRARLLAASAPAELERYLGPDHPETRTAALLLQSLH